MIEKGSFMSDGGYLFLTAHPVRPDMQIFSDLWANIPRICRFEPRYADLNRDMGERRYQGSIRPYPATKHKKRPPRLSRQEGLASY